jgi:mono/diheme cytochrome c family protein
MKRLFCASFLAVVLSAGTAVADAPDTETIYLEHCAGCHGGDRLGGMGPALLPENLGRLRKKAAHDLIANGRPATQMPVYGDKLNAAEIDALVLGSGRNKRQPYPACRSHDSAQGAPAQGRPDEFVRRGRGR